MAVVIVEPEDDGGDTLGALYIDSHTVSEAFTAAGDWLARNDGRFDVKAVTLEKLSGGDEHNWELTVFGMINGGKT